jgi:hypothetical protein
MYASIERYDQADASEEALLPAGRLRADALGRLPGFVAYVLVDAGDGQLLAISLFEDEEGLQAAAELPALGPGLERESATQPTGQPHITQGEVLVQKGL